MIFLFYTVLLLLFLMTTMFKGLRILSHTLGWEDYNTKIFFFGYFSVCASFIIVLELFITHIIFISKGVTTIEYRGNIMEFLNTEGNIFWDNLIEIMGKNRSYIGWLWPSSKIIYINLFIFI
jgi:hypothetical protein